MNKRLNKPGVAATRRKRNTNDMFEEMMQKPALNGGFNTLMAHVQQIRDVQEAMVVKVDNIHEAIYDPDNGLFSRVKDVENRLPDSEKYDKLSEDISALKQQARLDEHDNVVNEKDAEAQKRSLDVHDEQLKELKRFKDRVVTIAKWCLVTASGLAATIIAKLLYDFASGHIRFM